MQKGSGTVSGQPLIRDFGPQQGPRASVDPEPMSATGEVENLRNALANLAESVDSLEGRLHPVLEHPRAEDCTKSEELCSKTSPLLDDLLMLQISVSNLTYRVNSIRERVQA